VFLNMVSMTVFPFIASPVLKELAEINDEQFRQLMIQRAQKIPGWIKEML